MAHTQPTHCRFAMSKAGFQHVAHSPEGQRLGSRKALSLGGSRERSGRGEFFTRSRMIGTTHSKARNVCSVSARYQASSFKAIMRGVPREKARSEPVVSAPPPPRRCLSAAPLLPCRCLPRRCLPHILLPKFCYTTNSSPGLNLAAAGVGTRAVDCLRVETEGVSLRTDRKA